MGGLFAQIATVLGSVLSHHPSCRTVVWLVDRGHARLWTIKHRDDGGNTGEWHAAAGPTMSHVVPLALLAQTMVAGVRERVRGAAVRTPAHAW